MKQKLSIGAVVLAATTVLLAAFIIVKLNSIYGQMGILASSSDPSAAVQALRGDVSTAMLAVTIGSIVLSTLIVAYVTYVSRYISSFVKKNAHGDQTHRAGRVLISDRRH